MTSNITQQPPAKKIDPALLTGVEKRKFFEAEANAQLDAAKRIQEGLDKTRTAQPKTLPSLLANRTISVASTGTAQTTPPSPKKATGKPIVVNDPAPLPKVLSENDVTALIRQNSVNRALPPSPKHADVQPLVVSLPDPLPKVRSSADLTTFVAANEELQPSPKRAPSPLRFPAAPILEQLRAQNADAFTESKRMGLGDQPSSPRRDSLTDLLEEMATNGVTTPDRFRDDSEEVCSPYSPLPLGLELDDDMQGKMARDGVTTPKGFRGDVDHDMVEDFFRGKAAANMASSSQDYPAPVTFTIPTPPAAPEEPIPAVVVTLPAAPEVPSPAAVVPLTSSTQPSAEPGSISRNARIAGMLVKAVEVAAESAFSALQRF